MIRWVQWIARNLVGIAAVTVATIMLLIFVTTPLDIEPQFVLGGMVFLFALAIGRIKGDMVTNILMFLSFAASSRYIYWRITNTLDFDSILDYFFGFLLMLAEIYAYIVLLLGFFQTVRLLNRKPIPLPKDTSLWPTVDIYVPTYNEPLDVVRPTVLAALGLDWPKDKLNVYILDDGRRPFIRDFAAKAKCHYIIRPDNKHAKAGNINYALTVTKGELIAIFDCDHIATRSFLQLAVGWFLKDPKLGMMQTPHHFYNADPVEKNMDIFRKTPNEGELFYGLCQMGNDFWNATFFCGSCAIIRRATLMSIGGMATYSITEDALTALCFQRKGWGTGYLSIRMSGGLATETLAMHVTQRIRWAQGMAQIFRTNNPLLRGGLTVGQRLCYLNAMFHFFYGLPRVVFIGGPLAYLIFGAHVCNTSAPMLLAYVLPHLAHAITTNSRTKGKYRYSFWDNIYETVLAIYILWPTTLALINPKAGSFKVTDKGVTLEKGGFDKKVAKPYVIMLLIVMLGVMFALVRLLLWDYYDTGTVLINLAWALASVNMLGAALGCAYEEKQRRTTHRVDVKLQAMVETTSGHTRTAETRNLSLGGCALVIDDPSEINVGDNVNVAIFVGGRETMLPATVKGTYKNLWRFQFRELSLREEFNLVQTLFGRPDAWLDWEKDRPPDKPLESYRNIIKKSFGSIWKVAKENRKQTLSYLGVIFLAGLVFLMMHTGWRIGPVGERFVALFQLLWDKLGMLARSAGG